MTAFIIIQKLFLVNNLIGVYRKKEDAEVQLKRLTDATEEIRNTSLVVSMLPTYEIVEIPFEEGATEKIDEALDELNSQIKHIV